jgi:hypothetical protein
VVLRWLAHGYELPFREGARPQPFHQGVSCPNLPPDAREFLAKELQRSLDTGALEPATSTRWVTKAFLIPKPGCPGRWRLVLDFRHLNTFFKELSCKYETLKVLRDILEPNDWMFSLDLQDAYHAIAVAEEHRPYLTFAIEGFGYFQCSALSFGLSCSRYVFTKCMRVMVQALRSPMRMLELYEDSARERAAAARRAAEPKGYVPPHRRAAQRPPPQPGEGRTLRSLFRRHRLVMRPDDAEAGRPGDIHALLCAAHCAGQRRQLCADAGGRAGWRSPGCAGADNLLSIELRPIHGQRHRHGRGQAGVRQRRRQRGGGGGPDCANLSVDGGTASRGGHAGGVSLLGRRSHPARLLIRRMRHAA